MHSLKRYIALRSGYNFFVFCISSLRLLKILPSISRGRSGSSTSPSPAVLENMPQFVEPISVCTCSANFFIACPYHMMKLPLTDEDPQAVKQEPFTGNPSTCTTSDIHGVSCSPSPHETSDGSYAPDPSMKIFGVWITDPGRGFPDFSSSSSVSGFPDSSSSSSVSSPTSKRKRQEEETATMEKDQAEKTSDGSSAPVQYIVRLLSGGTRFFDFILSDSSQTNKRKRKEEDSTAMENEGASLNGGLNHQHHQPQQQEIDIEKEAERLGISLELTLEFPYTKIESPSSTNEGPSLNGGLNHKHQQQQESDVEKEIERLGFSLELSLELPKINIESPSSTTIIAPGVVVDSWVFRKKLTVSDVAIHQSRLLLTKRSVEEHLLPILGFPITKKGTKIVVRDLDEKSDHQLTLTLWSDGKSYVLIKNWRKDFVERRDLKDGDEIELCRKASEAAFTFRLLHKRIRRPEEEGSS